jgi:uncharacterized protein (TIGR02453 family)
MSFPGFSREGTKFFVELARRQDREWFQAHKQDYEALWLQPMKELLAELEKAAKHAYKGQPLKPPKIFRIHRDVRFSKDKTPYKTHIAGMIALEGGATGEEDMGGAAAVYMHFGLEDTIGAGHWALAPDSLKRYRKLVDNPKTGAELAKKLAALEKKGFEVSAFESLKRVPPGFDPEHPRAALLKHKGLGFTFPKVPAGVRTSPKLAGWMASRIAETAPVIAWLDRAVR